MTPPGTAAELCLVAEGFFGGRGPDLRPCDPVVAIDAATGTRGAVVGGGLLGVECANALLSAGARTVCGC